MEYVRLLKAAGYSDDDISLYIDAMFELAIDEVYGDGFDNYVRTNYPGMIEAMSNKDVLNNAVINHLAKMVTNGRQ